MFSDLLIGKVAEIVESTDPSLIGRSGTIVNESKNLLHLMTDNHTIRIPKNVACFRIEQNGRLIVLRGKEILGTPQERIKG